MLNTVEKINLSGITYDSIVDGPGIRATIFFQGCKHQCVGCHNRSTWSMEDNNLKNVREIVDEIKSNTFTKKVTLSGGDPLAQYPLALELAKELKKEGFDIWLYTGYQLQEIEEQFPEILNWIDALVDGKFEIDKRDLSLEFKGSSNQRIFKIKDGKTTQIS